MHRIDALERKNLDGWEGRHWAASSLLIVYPFLPEPGLPGDEKMSPSNDYRPGVPVFFSCILLRPWSFYLMEKEPRYRVGLNCCLSSARYKVVRIKAC